MRRSVSRTAMESWFRRFRGRLAASALICLPAVALAQKGSAPIDGIRPGVSTRAEVDLAWGEPRARFGDQTFEYLPPAALSGAERAVVSYFADTTQVSRLDIYLTNPTSLEQVRTDTSLGARTFLRDRERGEQEELYAGSFRGLILSSKESGALVSGLSYLSARFLADLYADRFHQYMRDKRYADARVEADKVVAIDSDYARGYLLQGDYLVSQGNDEEALARYIAAAAAKYSVAYVMNAHLVLIDQFGLRKKLVDKAQAEFQQVLAGAATSAQRLDAHLRYAEVLVYQKRDAEALKTLNGAVEINPNSPRARVAIGDYYFTRRDFANAQPHYEVVVRLLDKGPVAEDAAERRRKEIYFRYAYAANRANDRDQAERYYRAVLALDPREAQTLNNLANILRETHRISEALDLYRRGLAVLSNDRLILNNYAETLVRDGQYEEARKQAQRELTLNADDGTAMAVMARAWAAQGKKKEALDYLRRSSAAGYRNRELASDPAFQKIRNDDAFQKIAVQMRPN